MTDEPVIICERYLFKALPKGFCVRRHERAKLELKNEALDACRTCDKGREAAGQVKAAVEAVVVKAERKTINDAKEKEKGMGAIKTCIGCKEEYTATSNVQKRCSKCGAAHKREGQKKLTANRAKQRQAGKTAKASAPGLIHPSATQERQDSPSIPSPAAPPSPTDAEICGIICDFKQRLAAGLGPRIDTIRTRIRNGSVMEAVADIHLLSKELNA